jgi:Pyruvate/2-oxoacid:ferredoxin oxidoreductase delta subunit/DNA-binding MarR family transcriptional regulator
MANKAEYSNKEVAMANLYEEVQERLDKFPQGFPKTKSGVEMEILKQLFTPEEAEVMLFLRPFLPEPVSTIAERAGRDEKELAEILYRMSKKGLIFRFQSPEQQFFYFLLPWMIGIWEFQLKNLNPENIKLYERYFEEGMVQERKSSKTPGGRIIPVEKEIQGMAEIQPYEKVSEIINSHTKFAVAECICRKEKRIMGEGCEKPLEACMAFGPMADYSIENGLGREISKEEARQILLKAEEEGLVHFSSNHSGAKMFICNCCGCCCKALGYITKYNLRGVVAKSNYYARVNEETCSACEVCLDRCQVEAIQIQNDYALINQERCIGCGLCVSSCPTESISMVPKLSEERSVIFPDQIALLQAIGKEKNKEYPFT